MTSKEVRNSFIEFFKQRAHTVVPSASVVPLDDPTLLFTNAGMNQFKPIFLGREKRDYTRAVDTQKCIRVSGKHNDLEEVGQSLYHHTFFEMLGNWSFGDYFKREAIAWAWELMTAVWKMPKDKLYATVYEDDNEAEELWRKETDIAHDHILRCGKKDNFWEMGETGPCGPCSEIHIDRGPEYDDDPNAFVNTGSPRYIELWNLVFIQFNRQADGTLKPLPQKHVDTGAGLERITAVLDGKRSNYETDLFMPLMEKIQELSGKAYTSGEGGTPHRVIADHVRCLTFALCDGAMPSHERRGYVLRRILRRASLKGFKLDMHEPFIYKLVPILVDQMGDTFPELKARHQHASLVIKAEEEHFGKTLDRGIELADRYRDQSYSSAYSVFPEILQKAIKIAGQIRSQRTALYEQYRKILEQPALKSFLQMQKEIDQTAQPIREAQRKLYEMTQPVREVRKRMGMALQPIQEIQQKYKEMLRGFAPALKSLETAIAATTIDYTEILKRLQEIPSPPLTGSQVFKLYDTHGFPVDLTTQIAREYGLQVDEEGFQEAMKAQRERARKAGKFTGVFEASALLVKKKVIDVIGPTKFVGYNTLRKTSNILVLLPFRGNTIDIIAQETPFYVESGGQVSDIGTIKIPAKSKNPAILKVEHLVKQNDIIIHTTHAEDISKLERLKNSGGEYGFRATLIVDENHRIPTQYNHTATHLLHKALREIFGDHVHQQGSLVAPDHLRFDYSHFQKPTPDQLADIENRVNEMIRANLLVSAHDIPLKQAQDFGAMALFGEKYDEEVRMIQIGETDKLLPWGDERILSRELCGGCHVHRTGDMGLFVIRAETAAAAGIRRIEALTGSAALQYLADRSHTVDAFTEELASHGSDVLDKLRKTLDEKKGLEKELAKVKAEIAGGEMKSLAASAIDIAGVKFSRGRTEADSLDHLKEIGDALRDGLKSGIGLLVTLIDSKPHMVCVVTPDLVGKGVDAVPIVKQLGKRIQGGGGGKPHLATAGGRNPDGLDNVLKDAPQVVQDLLQTQLKPD